MMQREILYLKYNRIILKENVYELIEDASAKFLGSN